MDRAVLPRVAARRPAGCTRSGRLIDVLAPVTEVLDQACVDQDVVRQLRILIDAITPGL